MSISEHFEAWPHDAEGIVREALREYVGDGYGEDEKVLAAYVDQVRAVARREGQAEALRAAARSMRSHKDPGHWNLRDEIYPVNAGQSPDAWLERRADRIENGGRHVDQ